MAIPVSTSGLCLTAGRYHKAKTLLGNVPPKAVGYNLLQRFDLWVPMLDSADTVRDRLLSSVVLDTHGVKQEEAAAPARHRTWSPSGPSLRQVLRPGPDFRPLPPALMRDYIACAQALHPRLSENASAVLLEYFRQVGAHGTPLGRAGRCGILCAWVLVLVCISCALRIDLRPTTAAALRATAVVFRVCCL